MDNNSKISFGDNVRVVKSEITIQKKLAGLKGEIYGETTPTASGVEVIGELKSDFALNVHFEELEESFWFAPELLEFINHNEGLKIGIANKEWIRSSEGEWIKSKKSNNWFKGLFDLFTQSKKA